MERRKFLRNTLITAGSILLGGAVIHRFQNDKETADSPLPPAIEKIHRGNGKNVLVLMSAGTRHGNTDRLTDAYIKGLVERGHSVTKVYLGSMRIERLYAISVNDTYPSKDMVLLMTAGDDKETTFEQPLRYFHLISQVFGGNEKGIYLAGGCTGCEKPAREISQEHLENAYKMGLEL